IERYKKKLEELQAKKGEVEQQIRELESGLEGAEKLEGEARLKGSQALARQAQEFLAGAGAARKILDSMANSEGFTGYREKVTADESAKAAEAERVAGEARRQRAQEQRAAEEAQVL